MPHFLTQLLLALVAQEVRPELPLLVQTEQILKSVH
jgi:hypothetical protein